MLRSQASSNTQVYILGRELFPLPREAPNPRLSLASLRDRARALLVLGRPVTRDEDMLSGFFLGELAVPDSLTGAAPSYPAGAP